MGMNRTNRVESLRNTVVGALYLRLGSKWFENMDIREVSTLYHTIELVLRARVLGNDYPYTRLPVPVLIAINEIPVNN